MYRGTSAGAESFLTNALGHVTSFVDTGADERHDLLLQGVRRERQRRRPDSRTKRLPRPTGARRAGRPLPTHRRLQSCEREPALGRRPLVERESSARLRAASTSPLDQARLLASRPPVPPGATTPQYGPDVEVWARLSTLAGVNNQLRLYARLQMPGTSTYDGYMLRTNQTSGNRPDLARALRQRRVVNRL